MSIAMGLGLTAAIFVVVAIVFAATSDGTDRSQRYAKAVWSGLAITAFALAVIAALAGVWALVLQDL